MSCIFCNSKEDNGDILNPCCFDCADKYHLHKDKVLEKIEPKKEEKVKTIYIKEEPIDTSKNTLLIIMGFCALIGFARNGLGGAFVGMIGGIGIAILVLSAQDFLKG
jgi:hypothetical protein